jgi:hypothetical protein
MMGDNRPFCIAFGIKNKKALILLFLEKPGRSTGVFFYLA